MAGEWTKEQLAEEADRLIASLQSLQGQILHLLPEDGGEPSGASSLHKRIDTDIVRVKEWTTNIKRLEEGSQNFNFAQHFFRSLQLAVQKASSLVKNCGQEKLVKDLPGAVEMISESMNVLNERTEVQQMSAQKVKAITKKESKSHSEKKKILVEKFKGKLRTQIGTGRLQRRVTFGRRRSSSKTQGLPKPVDFGLLDWFWKEVNQNKELKTNSINFTNPHDGLFFSDEDINHAKIVVDAFCTAWEEVRLEDETESDCPQYDDETFALDRFRNMHKVILTLSIIQGGHHGLNDFIASNRDDEDLHFPDLQELSNIFKTRGEHDLSTMFLAQQYRVKKRDWPEKKHVFCHAHEPIPLKPLDIVSQIGKNSWTTVEKVEDISNGEIYALKRLTFNAKTAEVWENERRILEKISRNGTDNHIVSLVKTYQRGFSELGCVIKPLTDWDLTNLMRHYCDHQERRKWVDSLLMGFGCLSFGLRHLHKMEWVRHKDIKPDNILFDSELRKFFWVDFGAASEFHGEGNQASVSYNPKMTGSEAYAAPEIGTEDAHGRATDIFSLGATFLEIVSALVYHELDPKPHGQGQGVRKFFNYKDQMRELDAWIRQAKEFVEKSKQMEWAKPLSQILSLAARMMKHNANERPGVSEVILELKRIGQANEGGKYKMQFFCKQCEEKTTHNEAMLLKEKEEYRLDHPKNIFQKAFALTRKKAIMT